MMTEMTGQKKVMMKENMVKVGMIGMKMTGKDMSPEVTNGNDLKDEAKDMRKDMRNVKEKGVASPRAKARTKESPKDRITGAGGRLRGSLPKTLWRNS